MQFNDATRCIDFSDVKTHHFKVQTESVSILDVVHLPSVSYRLAARSLSVVPTFTCSPLTSPSTTACFKVINIQLIAVKHVCVSEHVQYRQGRG